MSPSRKSVAGSGARAKPSPSKHTIKCPTCGASVDYFADPLGPFCSSRCKMVDLGRWLGEEYRISEPLRADDFGALDELPEQVDHDFPE